MLLYKRMLKDRYSYDDLIDILNILNSDCGCPWDKEQTHLSIVDNLIEEAYEAKQAILNNSSTDMIEELGDVLLQPLFHGIIASRNHNFDINDIIDSLAKKLIYRHSYIFGNDKVSNSSEALDLWIANKQKSPYQSLKTLPPDFPLELKIKKVKRALIKNKIIFANFDDTLETQMKDLNAKKQAVDNTIATMIDLLKSEV